MSILGEVNSRITPDLWKRNLISWNSMDFSSYIVYSWLLLTCAFTHKLSLDMLNNLEYFVLWTLCSGPPCNILYVLVGMKKKKKRSSFTPSQTKHLLLLWNHFCILTKQMFPDCLWCSLPSQSFPFWASNILMMILKSSHTNIRALWSWR